MGLSGIHLLRDRAGPKSGRTSAPCLPQAAQTKRWSVRDSRTAVFKCRSNQTDKRVSLLYNLDVNVEEANHTEDCES
jgi:hypothetical protein